MNVRGTWNSAVTGRKVMVITNQTGPSFAGVYYTAKGDVPDDHPFPVFGFVTEIGPRDSGVRRIAWTVCWDYFDEDHVERAHFSSVAGWAGRIVPKGEGVDDDTIEAMWLLSADPSHGFRVGDDREWASVRIGGDAILVRSPVEMEAPGLPEKSQFFKSADLRGRWQNDLGSIFEVTAQDGTFFEGTYTTAVGTVAGAGSFPVTGQVTQLGHPAYARVGFSVCYDCPERDPEGSSVAVFCGRLLSAGATHDKQVSLEMLWIVSHDPSPAREGRPADSDRGEWNTKSVGKNVFHRIDK